MVRYVDATWFMPGAGDAAAAFACEHVPGAVFFDIEQVADRSSPLPHMLPSAAEFARAVGRLGIGNDDDVVVYDAHGVMSAPRAWWTFRVFGHDRVTVLDGGLPGWRREGRAVESGAVSPPPARFEARYRPQLVRTREQVLAAARSGEEQIVDARSAGRFAGRDPEPRPGLRSGQIPGSLNVPFTTVLDGGRFKPPEALRAVFRDAGVDPARPTICTCGSGITACVLAYALYLLGNSGAAVYDGSWAEWGAVA